MCERERGSGSRRGIEGKEERGRKRKKERGGGGGKNGRQIQERTEVEREGWKRKREKCRKEEELEKEEGSERGGVEERGGGARVESEVTAPTVS